MHSRETAVDGKKPTRIYVRRPRMPQGLKEGDLVFEHKDWLTYFDLAEMTPRELKTQWTPGTKAFLDELVGEEGD